MKVRIDRELPHDPQSNTEREDPKREVPYKDSAEPNFNIFLHDMEEPSVKKSNAVRFCLNRVRSHRIQNSKQKFIF